MKRSLRVWSAAAVLAAVTMSLPGCGVAMLVVAATLAGQVSANDRQHFAEYNIEREKAGLEPLTWESYRKHRPAEVDETTRD